MQRASKDEVAATLVPPTGTAAFAPPSELFVTKSNPMWKSSDSFNSTTVSEAIFMRVVIAWDRFCVPAAVFVQVSFALCDLCTSVSLY